MGQLQSRSALEQERRGRFAPFELEGDNRLEIAVLLCCELVLFSGVLFQQIMTIRNPYVEYDANGDAIPTEARALYFN